MPRTQIEIRPDELKRAFTSAYLKSDSPSEEEDSSLAEEACGEENPAEKALRLRVLLILLWLATENDSRFVAGTTALGVPEIHPLVFEVAATIPLPRMGVPRPDPFVRELERRAKGYAVLTGIPV